MATHNIVITYPDLQGPRILAALKDKAKTEENPSPTNAQALAWLNEAAKNSLRDVVLRYEKGSAITAAAATVLPTDVT